MLDVKEAAATLGFSVGKLRALVAKGDGPMPIRVGGRLYFTETLLREWVLVLEAQAISEVNARGKIQKKDPRLPKPILRLPVSRSVHSKKIQRLTRWRGGSRTTSEDAETSVH